MSFNLNNIKNLSPVDAKKEIDKFFIPLDDGNHAVLKNGVYVIQDEATIKKVYFNRMTQKELKTYYFETKTDIRTITFDLFKPTLYDGYLNICPMIKHSYSPYDAYTQEIKDKVNIMLNHIKEVLCSDNIDEYEFFVKWLSNMIKGNRNISCVYLKSSFGGTGKSTLTEFLRTYVIGNALCHQGGSAPLKTKFNSELSCKLMVIFEELENFSTQEWTGISCKLRTIITSPTLMIERKGLDAREETNFNNYFINTNVDAIQDDDGRRIFIPTISSKYVKNRVYFDRLYTCFNDEVGKAFYSYLYEINLDEYDAQDFPLTQSKLDAVAKRLGSVYRFIKDEYILKKLSIERHTVQQLHDEYKIYCLNNSIKKQKHKIDFNKDLESVGIVYYKSSKENVFKVSYETLLEISDKFKWVHNLDEVQDDESSNNSTTTNDDDFFHPIKTDYKSKYEELLEKFTQLEEQIKYKQILETTVVEESELEKELKALEESEVPEVSVDMDEITLENLEAFNKIAEKQRKFGKRKGN